MNQKKNLVWTALSLASCLLFLVFLTLSYISYLQLMPHECNIVFKPLIVVFAGLFVISSIASHSKEWLGESLQINKTTKRRITILSIFLTLLYTVFLALIRYYWCYGQVDVEQIFYHTFVSSAGMDFSTVFTIAIPSLIGCFIFAVVIFYVIKAMLHIVSNISKNGLEKSCKKFAFSLGLTSILSLILVLCQLFQSIPILKFTYYQNFTESSFIKDNYVDPKTTKIIFPEQKRNLVYIYLESVENTFLDIDSGGAFEQNLMPEYTKLCQDNINFSNTNKIGGALRTYGITYTTAGIFAQGFGLPLKVGVETSAIHPNSILPNKYNMFDILNDAGYSQHVVMGSDIDFGGLRELFESHGDMNIYDYQYMVDTGFVDKGYKVFWGVEDEILYDFSKRKLNEISKNDEPFVFVMETVDTHNPNGYVCGLCQNDHDSQYANVVACASRQLEDFMSWSKQQDWYDNTTFVIVGDHLSMKNDFFTDIDSRYDRTTVNCFVNAINTNKNTQFVNRQFSSLDMFPTILSAIGFKIEGNRLGLGTNLFSNQKTIFEEYGYSYINQEFKKNSTFYKNLFTGE